MESELVKAIVKADEALIALYALMIETLEAPDTDYLIQFQGKIFDICKPITHDDKKLFKQQAHDAVQLLLSDALRSLLKYLKYHDDLTPIGDFDAFRRVWVNVANLHRATTREESRSTITSDQPYLVDEGTSKPLDLKSIYVQAERKDLSSEEKWNILLSSCMDKESFSAKEGT